MVYLDWRKRVLSIGVDSSKDEDFGTVDEDLSKLLLLCLSESFIISSSGQYIPSEISVDIKFNFLLMEWTWKVDCEATLL